MERRGQGCSAGAAGVRHLAQAASPAATAGLKAVEQVVTGSRGRTPASCAAAGRMHKRLVTVGGTPLSSTAEPLAHWCRRGDEDGGFG
eukprot:scaffold4044_cov399-Prasinococcus_capsulatus_cf.AAC.2